MKLVSRSASRFKEWLRTTDGRVFRGRIGPLSDTGAVSTSFLEAREVLHVLPDEIVGVGDCILTPTGRVFLLAQYDTTPDVRVSFRLFPMTKSVVWTRSVTTVDPVTGLTRDTADGVNMGPLWILLDLYGREELDRGLYIQAERQRLITGGALQLNDKVDTRQVRRINTVYGVTVAETE